MILSHLLHCIDQSMSNISIYNDCKNGIKEANYIHPTLKEILKPTYGIIIYQEQVMQIAQTLAGFTAGEADILRRAMGKKKAELDKQKERFINGALKMASPKMLLILFLRKSNLLHNMVLIKVMQLHSFNCVSNSFKNLLQEDFIAATMSTELTNTSKLREFVEELKKLKIEIIKPSINKCFSDFKANNGKIFYGLGAIKNVGFEAISNIVNERETNGIFKSFFRFH